MKNKGKKVGEMKVNISVTVLLIPLTQ